MSFRILAVPTIVGLIAAVAFATTATAGKGGGGKVSVKDPADPGGERYDAETYKRCDIRKVQAKVKGKKLVVTVTLSDKHLDTSLFLNTKGGKTSGPEYTVDRAGTLTDQKDHSQDFEAAKIKLKGKDKKIQSTLALKKIGRPKKTGFQAKTCFEGAVDVAPGPNYFDLEGSDAEIDFKYKNIKTR